MDSLLFALFLPILLFILLDHKKRKQANLPPSPFQLPIIGNLHQLGSSPHRALDALSKKYGPLMFMKLGHVPTLVVSSADMAREVMKIHDLNFSGRPHSVMAEQLMYGKDVAFAPYGEYWRQARKLCVSHLLSLKRVESFRPVREEEMALAIDYIRSSSMMGTVNMSALFVSVTNDITCRVAFGKKYLETGGGDGLRKLIAEYLELLGGFHVGEFFPWLSWVSRFNGVDARAEKNSKEWDDLLSRIVKDHEDAKKDGGANEGIKDFVDVLLQLQKDGLAEFPITHDHIKALVMDVFAAGTDTSYSTLEWAMAELMRHPKVMKRLQEEVRALGRVQSIITEDNLNHLKFLKSVIKETLRVHPPLPLLVPRESIEDVQINGYDIPAKTRVIVSAWSIGRDSKSWKNSEEFQPERFLSGGSDVDYKGNDFESIPFGAGRRGCPGGNYALVTIELILANILYHFDWEIPNKASVEDLDMDEASGLTVHKKNVLLLVAKPHIF